MVPMASFTASLAMPHESFKSIHSMMNVYKLDRNLSENSNGCGAFKLPMVYCMDYHVMRQVFYGLMLGINVVSPI
jgi:hypothetical protein